MRELGYESISGTPGTAAALTVSAVSSPIAYPRLSAIAPAGVPVHYVIESSAGQVLALGVGYSGGAGSFTRQYEFSQWNGTTYTRDPATLYSLPSGCIIYCGAGSQLLVPGVAPPSSAITERWTEPGLQVVGSTTFTPTLASRDHFWRARNLLAYQVDALHMYIAGVGTLDFGIYEVDWSNGNPGKLLLGWQGVTTVVGNNTLLFTAATLGALSAVAQSLPLGDLFFMYNVSATSITCTRTVDLSHGLGGNGMLPLSSGKPMLYLDRTNNTSFGDSPSVTWLNSSNTKMPGVSFRGV